MQLRQTQRNMAVWECYCSFHFVVEVKVSCIFVERNTAFRYAYHFIRKCCVLHIYLTIAVGKGWYLPKMLCRWVHGVAQVRNRKTLQGSKESKRYVHEIIEHMWPLIHMRNLWSVFICHTTHFRCQTDFINFHILTLVWSLNVVSCITIRVAGFFYFIFYCRVFKYDKFRTWFLIKHALSILSVHYWGLHMRERCFMLGLYVI